MNYLNFVKNVALTLSLLLPLSGFASETMKFSYTGKQVGYRVIWGALGKPYFSLPPTSKRHELALSPLVPDNIHILASQAPIWGTFTPNFSNENFDFPTGIVVANISLWTIAGFEDDSYFRYYYDHENTSTKLRLNRQGAIMIQQMLKELGTNPLYRNTPNDFLDTDIKVSFLGDPSSGKLNAIFEFSNPIFDLFFGKISASEPEDAKRRIEVWYNTEILCEFFNPYNSASNTDLDSALKNILAEEYRSLRSCKINLTQPRVKNRFKESFMIHGQIYNRVVRLLSLDPKRNFLSYEPNDSGSNLWIDWGYERILLQATPFLSDSKTGEDKTLGNMNSNAKKSELESEVRGFIQDLQKYLLELNETYVSLNGRFSQENCTIVKFDSKKTTSCPNENALKEALIKIIQKNKDSLRSQMIRIIALTKEVDVFTSYEALSNLRRLYVMTKTIEEGLRLSANQILPDLDTTIQVYSRK